VQKASGRLILAAGILAWAWSTARLFPFDFEDIGYLFSLQGMQWADSEWTHPLYVPLLHPYAALLRLAGWSGRMLVPCELLNVAAGAATLLLLGLWAESLCGSSLIAAAATLLLAFSEGFTVGCLRTAPYAPAALLTVVSAILLLEGRPASAGKRWAASGAAAGLAAGLHLGALALPAAVFVWARSSVRPPKERTARLLRYSAGFGAALAASFAVFVWVHSVSPSALLAKNPRDFFHGIEQVPGTSIYSNPSPARQALDYLRTLLKQGEGGIAVLFALAAVLFAARRRNGERDAAEAFAFVSSAAFAAFFALNNSQNGFIFSSLLLAPVAVALEFSRRRRLGQFFAALGLWLAAGAARGALDSAACPDSNSDPRLSEASFLDRTLGKDGLLLLTGCPERELFYHASIRGVVVAEQPSAAAWNTCPIPVVAADARLRARIDYYRARGSGVLLALRPGPSVPLHGAERGSFHIRSPGGLDYLRWAPKHEEGKATLLPLSKGYVPFDRLDWLRDWRATEPSNPWVESDLADENRRLNKAAGPAEARLAEGIRSYQAGDRIRALKAFSEAIRLEPGCVEAYISRGAVLGDTGDWKRALGDYDRALKLHPTPELAAALRSSREKALRRLSGSP
jgi:tetratricopeptide (TPR) repeat protein